MQTITPEYAELNRRLHETDATYGNGSWRHEATVLELCAEQECRTVLDYGCGKGLLKRALGEANTIFEYDPAIPGKDQPPEPADLVVCTDVLEHIEPELLDNVLKHIAKLSRKMAFIVIATRPAKKTLADGRNAHLIVQDAEWWREKLEKIFFFKTWTVVNGEATLLGVPIGKIGGIIPKSAVSDTIRYEQALRNCTLVKSRVKTDMPRHDRRVCIVAYGPSLQQTWHTLRHERKLYGATIVSVSGAHDFLIERGIVPDIHIEVDPRVHKAHFTRNSHANVKYWIASCCHPSLIDNLIEHKREIALWHVYNSDTDFKIVDVDGPDPKGFLICGGGSVGCRAVNVIYTQGYRTFSIYGMDCSFAADGNQHAGYHSGKPQHEWAVRVEGSKRWFRTSANLVYTARGFFHNYRVLLQAAEANNEPFIDGTDDRVEIFFNGDGLMQEMAGNLMTKVKQAA